MDEYAREPCPDRILEDVGSAFSMGFVGGTLFTAFRGYRNAPSPFKSRLWGMQNEVRFRAPVIGVQFAAWGGVFSICDCTLVALRKKEDAINSIASGAATGALLACRSGKLVMLASAGIGGMILGLIEGASFLMQRFMSANYDPTQMPQPEDPHALQQLPSKNPVDTSSVPLTASYVM